jgi:GT2 family glycosyltransferase
VIDLLSPTRGRVADMKTPLISVIVLNWNGRPYLPVCLDALRCQTFSDFETIVVDNGSTDGSQKLIRDSYPEVKLIELEANQGFCGGNNVGIRASASQFLVLLNNDTQVEHDWLFELYSAINNDPTVAIADSKLLFFDSPDTVQALGAEYSNAGGVQSRCFGEIDRISDDTPSEVFVCIACAAIYRRSALDRIGLLDEMFFAGYEDVDISFRAHLVGYRCLNVPSARVLHHLSLTHGRNSPDFVLRSQRNIHYVYIKNMPGWLFWKYLPLHLFYACMSFFYFLSLGRSGPYLRAKLSVLRNMGLLLKKRREVQSLRRVDPHQINAILAHRGWFLPKLAKLWQGVHRRGYWGTRVS